MRLPGLQLQRNWQRQQGHQLPGHSRPWPRLRLPHRRFWNDHDRVNAGGGKMREHPPPGPRPLYRRKRPAPRHWPQPPHPGFLRRSALRAGAVRPPLHLLRQREQPGAVPCAGVAGRPHPPAQRPPLFPPRATPHRRACSWRARADGHAAGRLRFPMRARFRPGSWPPALLRPPVAVPREQWQGASRACGELRPLRSLCFRHHAPQPCQGRRDGSRACGGAGPPAPPPSGKSRPTGCFAGLWWDFQGTKLAGNLAQESCSSLFGRSDGEPSKKFVNRALGSAAKALAPEPRANLRRRFRPQAYVVSEIMQGAAGRFRLPGAFPRPVPPLASAPAEA